MQIGLILPPFLIALFVSAIVTPLVIFVFSKLGFVVDPAKVAHPAHVHKTPVPKGGGVPIYLGVVVVAVWLLKLDGHLVAILMAMTLTLAVGLVDDIKNISPLTRLVFNFLAALIIVSMVLLYTPIFY